MDAKVSVVVTCYNHEKYIEECLRSIFTQTYRNIELLVFNDGSTDGSGEIIERLLKDSPFPETFYFSEANQGVVRVRNLALSKQTGDFLLFMDSDNFLNDNHLELLLTELQEQQADIAYCQLWDFKNEKILLKEDLDYSLEKELEGNLIDVSSLVRTSVLKEVQFDEKLKNLEDYDFWLQVLLKNQAKAIYVKSAKLNYRLLSESRSQREDWGRYYQSYFYIIDKYRKIIPEELISALQKNVLAWLEQYEVLLADSKRIITEKDANLAALMSENDRLRNSRAFRLGNKLLGPFRK